MQIQTNDDKKDLPKKLKNTSHFLLTLGVENDNALKVFLEIHQV